MRAIAVTRLSDYRTKVVCGNKTYYVKQTEAPDPGDYCTPSSLGSFIVDDGEDQTKVQAMSAENAVERHLDGPPPTVAAQYPPFGTQQYQYRNHARGNRQFITRHDPHNYRGGYDVVEPSTMPPGTPHLWFFVLATTPDDAVDEYVRLNP